MGTWAGTDRPRCTRRDIVRVTLSAAAEHLAGARRAFYTIPAGVLRSEAHRAGERSCRAPGR